MIGYSLESVDLCSWMRTEFGLAMATMLRKS